MASKQQPVIMGTRDRLYASLSNINADAAFQSLSPGQVYGFKDFLSPGVVSGFKDFPGAMAFRSNQRGAEDSYSSRGSESSSGDNRTPSPPLLVQRESDGEWTRSPSPSMKDSAENQGNSAESREKVVFPLARTDAVPAPIVDSQGKLSLSAAELLLYQQHQHMVWWWYMYCSSLYSVAAAATVSSPQTPAPLRATPSTPLQEFKINEQQMPKETARTLLCPTKLSPQEQGCRAFINLSGKAPSLPRSAPPVGAQLDEDLLLCDESTEDFLSDDTRKRELPSLTEDVDMDEAAACDNPLEQPKKKARRSGQETRVCSNCGTDSTPFWRKGKFDGRPLCNACGLYSSKNDAMRPPMLWKREISPTPATSMAAAPPTQPSPAVIRPIPSRDSAFRSF